VFRNINGHAGLTHKTLFSFPFLQESRAEAGAPSGKFSVVFISQPAQSFLLAKGQYILGSFF
jgi:hypothetical protein